MPTSACRSLNFKWPADDVTKVRATYLQARRFYREPSPQALGLTLSSFTETAYRIARTRMGRWQGAVPTSRVQSTGGVPREEITVSWAAELAWRLDDDWDLLSELAANRRAKDFAPGALELARPQVLKSDVALVGILDALDDWPAWVRVCPNDRRRSG